MRIVDVFLTFSGTNQTQKTGNDVLLDLLSIGAPPAQNNSSISDMLTSSQDNKSPINILEQLSSPSAPTSQVSSGNSPMTDLLDGFSPKPGKTLTCAQMGVFSYEKS